MKVYLVFSVWYSPGPEPLYGVYATRERAQRAIDEEFRPGNPSMGFEIEECDVES